MSLHASVLRIKELYYPNWPEERGMCSSCGRTYDQGTFIEECPECGQSSYVIFEPALTELNFS